MGHRIGASGQRKNSRLPCYDRPGGICGSYCFATRRRNALRIDEAISHRRDDATRRREATHLSPSPTLTPAAPSLSRLGPWSSPKEAGNRALRTLYASFDLVAFGTCPYQPTRIQLHTQSHKHASKITKYHLLLSFNPPSTSPIRPLPLGGGSALFLSLGRAVRSPPSRSPFLYSLAHATRSRARVHRRALMAT